MVYMTRPMQLDDVPQAVQIDKECFPLNKRPMAYKNELMYNQAARYIVAYDDENPDRNSIMGVLGFWLMAGEAHIMTVAVRGEQRRRGIGELMLKAAIDLALSCGAFAITLEVRGSNSEAISLYRKHGFTERGLRKNYYDETHEDAVIMTRELNNQ
jgi:ribosomal-protein-alanine N-acetyltransferase